MKSTVLAVAAQLHLPKEDRLSQGHHRDSAKLYSRNDTFASLHVQRHISTQVAQGWRPQRSMARGGAAPHLFRCQHNARTRVCQLRPCLLAPGKSSPPDMNICMHSKQRPRQTIRLPRQNRSSRARFWTQTPKRKPWNVLRARRQTQIALQRKSQHQRSPKSLPYIPTSAVGLGAACTCPRQIRCRHTCWPFPKWDLCQFASSELAAVPSLVRLPLSQFARNQFHSVGAKHV